MENETKQTNTNEQEPDIFAQKLRGRFLICHSFWVYERAVCILCSGNNG